ncbi:hypothetical protein BCR41DRAFT_422428 [Lobosporangium transversale]|uniref:Uncharacterized protein n=1 Tax=Lobosporangium transversale TaxID=64571 RepID=A0A1Y2GLT9_9FUNG|nr:hypothetical protein BCR41DRAFT_422428 [Lobosporangium transversale]ORZ14925.1 hypothetical protein BCR41DRAFT_422428 [Lobosporangium transversale]|eukprot:XP_021881057.1 hypothetical protein BCR41DRAFT_422428 [Lobosporangium transversale]
MVKLLLLVLALVQACILGAQATHVIAFGFSDKYSLYRYAGICIRTRNGLVMQDYDTFAHTVNNFGYHKDGVSATVTFDTRSVNMHNPNWGRFQFPHYDRNGKYERWAGCFESPGDSCDYYHQAVNECDEFFRIGVWK